MAPSSNKKKTDAWAGSKGRSMLREDIRHGVIPANKSAEQVWQQHFRAEFDVGDRPGEGQRLFAGRLKTARAWVAKKLKVSAEEEAAMQADRLVRPAAAINARGEPRWPGSQAEAFLKQDVAAGLHLNMSLDDFHESRPEHHENHHKETIVGHVEQEVRTQKFLKQCRGRCEHQPQICKAFLCQIEFVESGSFASLFPEMSMWKQAAASATNCCHPCC